MGENEMAVDREVISSGKATVKCGAARSGTC